MSRNICIVLVCIFALFQNAKGRAANSKVFMKEVTQCCQHAMKEVAKQADPNCEAIGRQTAENVISGLICRTSAELCCVKQLQETSCNSGTAVARNGGTCAADSSLSYGTRDHQECCYCCYLGMEAKRRNMGCGKSAILGFPCQRAFLRCCLLRTSNPSGFPNVFGTVPPTRARRTCSSLACSQSCVLLNGVPKCRCRRGFKLNGNRRSCDDKNECVTRSICGQNKVCKNTYGSYLCVEDDQKVSCPVGLEVDSSGKQCQDIDECQDSPCKAADTCINNRGSYECRSRCPSAYVFRNGRCEKDCGSGYLWNGTRCVDKDECQQAGICPSNKRCVNTDGSHRCVPAIRCRRGYERVGQQCQDIDECVKYRSRRLCYPRTCVNRPGSYRCVNRRRLCRQGYELVNSKCQDIDECRRNLCRANERCINRPGTYRCERRCRHGYLFNGTACEDVNECLGRRRCSADKECINTAGSYRCRVKCSSGYERIQLQEDCQDINECEADNPCRSNEECQNFPGTYRCTRVTKCRRGYELYNGKCDDINECLVYGTCPAPKRVCVNIPGSYRCEYSACPAGFERDRYGYCVDINECATGRHICKPTAEECINLNGTYSCRCNPGYVLYEGITQCRDIDECKDDVCQHKCINTQGSFKCECRKGYSLADERNCLDVNECKRSGTCEHNCMNTQGSYYCQCKRGYSLHSNGASCTDIDECQKPELYGQCVYRCRNNLGSFACICPSGYERKYFRFCWDINECENGQNPCGSNGVCVNTKGGYKCLRPKCPNSYFTERSLTHCTRKSCQLNDPGCRAENRKSIRWHGRGLPNGAGPGVFSYFYNITTSGYRKKPQIRFSIKSGNYGNVFAVYSHGYGRASIRNTRVLKGPREYNLEFSGEVINKGGIVSARFITYLHVFVSRYKF